MYVLALRYGAAVDRLLRQLVIRRLQQFYFLQQFVGAVLVKQFLSLQQFAFEQFFVRELLQQLFVTVL